jgi:hypothetical protein
MLQTWPNRKDVENRRWVVPAPIRELLPLRIYLHGSQHMEPISNMGMARQLLTQPQWTEFYTTDFQKYRGAIMGELTIVSYKYRFGDENANLYSKWHFPGQYGFYTVDPLLYDKPIPCKGRPFFFNIELPANQSKEVQKST